MLHQTYSFPMKGRTSREALVEITRPSAAWCVGMATTNSLRAGFCAGLPPGWPYSACKHGRQSCVPPSPAVWVVLWSEQMAHCIDPAFLAFAQPVLLQGCSDVRLSSQVNFEAGTLAFGLKRICFTSRTCYLANKLVIKQNKADCGESVQTYLSCKLGLQQ